MTLRRLSTRLFGFVSLLLLAFAVSATAQSAKGTLTGSVVDDSGASLPGAQVSVTPGGITVATNPQGVFTIPNLAAGKYTVTASYIGFNATNSEVDIAAGQTATLPLQMKVASSSEEILVTAERPHGEAEAINETRTADNILQVLPAEVITSLPNANVADAVGRLPSVTLYRIEGEGVYLQVRGTEPRLTNVTVDNITIPAPEPNVRQVRLDIIPSDMVDAVQINKTLSANQDANGIGGSVNLRTKQAGEQATLNLYGNGGYTNILNGRNSFSYGGTAGKRFFADHRLGLLVNATYDFNGRGIDNIQPSLDPRSTFAMPFYDNDTIREYRYYRTRYGYDGSLDYRFTPNDGIFLRGFFSDLKDFGDKWYYSPVSTAISSSGALPDPSKASPAPKFYTSSKRPNASVGTIILGGHHAGSDSLLTWELSASRAYEEDSAGNPKADFSWIGPSVYCNYAPSAQTDLYHPHFGACDTVSTSPLQNPDNWVFKDITISTGINTDLALTAQASWAKSYSAGGHFGTFEAGFKFSNAHQSQDSTETVYDGWSTKAGGGAPTITQLQDSFNNTDYYSGAYFGGHYGPVSNFFNTQAYTYAHYGSNIDVQKTAADTYPNLFHTVEQITAGYLMNTIDLNRFHIQTGLRFENTRTLTFGYNVNFYGPSTVTGPCPTGVTKNCYTFTGVNNNPTYLDVLPSVQLRYALTQNSSLRAVYARGVARPDPYQLVPYITEDSTASPITVAIGNPALRPEHANNYDILYESYLQPLGLIQGGFFFKQLTGPQLQMVLPGGFSPTDFPPGYFPPAFQNVINQYPGDSITQTVNGRNAWIYGFELSFQQHLNYLPGVLRGLGIAANYSYTASRLKGLPLRDDHPTLIDQSPNCFNIGPTYDTSRFSARVGLAYNQASLFSYNYVSPTYVSGSDPNNLGPKGPTGDVYTLTHYQVDAQASYRFYKGLSVVASGLNLNNEVFGYYTGSTVFVNQREFYKPTYSGGLRYNFPVKR
ncbi:MAG TPA: TonB-dependent receptor [Acidobacteriaceae bacterium]|nr:TonB-dependent receptor [Acidobacteriaceae bacterium]